MYKLFLTFLMKVPKLQGNTVFSCINVLLSVTVSSRTVLHSCIEGEGMLTRIVWNFRSSLQFFPS